MLKGFKEFIMRGNLVDLAVAFVIGAAFAAVVDKFVSAVVTPIINAFPGASSDGFGFSLRHGDKFTGKDGKNTTFIDISAIINSIIVFVITAAVVYFIFVVPMQKVNARRKGTEEPEPEAVGEEIATLREIRDLLAQRSV